MYDFDDSSIRWDCKSHLKKRYSTAFLVSSKESLAGEGIEIVDLDAV